VKLLCVFVSLEVCTELTFVDRLLILLSVVQHSHKLCCEGLFSVGMNFILLDTDRNFGKNSFKFL